MTDEIDRETDATTSEQTDTEAHRERLNDAVESGGGCVEAWNAARESRNGNRRSFLAGVVASLFAGASITNVSAAETVSLDPDKETVELTAREKNRLVSDARSDERVNAMWQELVSRGLEPDLSSVTGYETNYQDREWQFVRIPFDARHSDSLDLEDDGDVAETGAIVWNTAAEIDPHGYVTTRTVDYDGDPTEVERELRERDVDLDSIDTVPVVIEHTKLWPDDADVRQETDSLTLPVEKNREVSTQGCDCNSLLANPLTLCAPCGIPDTDCIADLANVYSVEIVACGTCVGSSGWATPSCAVCVAEIIEEDDFGYFCCPCEACDGIIIC
ncbi:hypothetical protein [Halopiger goleimassiliensis]|uniref:hypothetical protein n=1 Tax=Halopiger goleimassiliensis TaxID=1293048 RepID=UPI0006777993|nr:hypothetical protein [Halopiger goleimassiliensis]